MTNSNQFNLSDHVKATDNLINELTDKIKYLKDLTQAVKNKDDRKVYQLIDSNRYFEQIIKENKKQKTGHEMLVKDIHVYLSNFLSENLIAYLRQMYPFFYFEELDQGDFQIYFGNWWGRRLFGTLDVLNVEFNFDKVEYAKLKKSFELESFNKRLNSDLIETISNDTDKLQELIDSQEKRDNDKEKIRLEIKKLSQEKSTFWRASEQKDNKKRLIDELSKLTELDEQANKAYKKIKENEEKVLSLSKEDTLMGYERQSIVKKYGSFANFEDRISSLYQDYIAELIAQGGNR